MDSEHKELDTLIDRLIIKTNSGDLRWKEGARWNSLQADFPDYSVIISNNKGLERSLEGDYSLRVINRKGEIVVSVPSGWGSSYNPVPDELTGKLEKLFEVAQTPAPISRKAISDLLSKLG